MKPLIRVLDFETTDEPPEADVIEAGFVDILGVPMIAGGTVWDLHEESARETMVDSDRPISFAAMAVHHLTKVDIAGGIHQDALADWLMQPTAGDGAVPVIFAAHNADFEKSLFNAPGLIWIDTYKVALRLYPDFEKHSNQYLRYALGLELDHRAMPPHKALPDAWTTAHILLRMLAKATVSQMVAWSNEPQVLPRVNFGKHRGSSWRDLPTDYMQWCLRQDFDAGVKHTIKLEMERRATEATG